MGMWDDPPHTPHPTPRINQSTTTAEVYDYVTQGMDGSLREHIEDGIARMKSLAEVVWGRMETRVNPYTHTRPLNRVNLFARQHGIHGGYFAAGERPRF